MMPVDVVVVGGGVMGAATARELAGSGSDVVLLEQHEVGHPFGSSHGASRIFRLSYPQASWVAAAQRALPLWRQLERESGESLLALHGGLDVGAPVAEHAGALQVRGAPHTTLDAAAATQRFPWLRVPAGTPVLHHPQAGVLRADRAWAWLVGSAAARGADIRQGHRVRRVRQDGDHVDVDLGDQTLRAGAVVVTAGAWAPPLLARAGISLDVTVTRETVAYFAVDQGPVASLVDWGAPARYALDAPGHRAAGHVVKAGEHHAGPVADPDAAGEPAADAVERISTWVARRFPGADPHPLGAETCLYTTTPDHDFVLRRYGRIVVGSPCSGHGFKFAPLVGRRLAGLALEACRDVR